MQDTRRRCPAAQSGEIYKVGSDCKLYNSSSRKGWSRWCCRLWNLPSLLRIYKRGTGIIIASCSSICNNFRTWFGPSTSTTNLNDMLTPPTFEATHPDPYIHSPEMIRQYSPTTSDRKQVPAFFVTWPLLTCDTSDDPGAKRVIAVTGTLAAEASSLPKTLPAREMSLDLAYNRLRSRVGHLRWWYSTSTDPSTLRKADLFSKKEDAKLPALISDVWAAMASYDLTDKSHFTSFCPVHRRALFPGVVQTCFRGEDAGMWVVLMRFTIGLLTMKISTEFGG